MGWRVWRPRKRTVLRLKDEGLPVAWLQERLQSLGYDVGPIDGVYGFLTEDCVYSLQREYGLRVDGIAGPQVMELLQDPQLQAGNSFAVWGAMRSDYPREVRSRHGKERYHRLAGLLLYCFSITEEGNTVGELPEAPCSLVGSGQVRLVPVISNFHDDLYDELALEALLRYSHTRRHLMDTVKRIVADPKTHGIALDLQGVGMGYGRRFATLMKGVRKLATQYRKRMYLVLVPNVGRQQALPQTVDTHIWRFLPDRVILQASLEHVAARPGPKMGLEWLQYQQQRVCRYIPAWKLMTMIPVDGVAWRVEGNLREYRYLSYDDARKLAYQRQAKIKWDIAEKVPYYDFVNDEGRFRVWFENTDSVRPKLAWLSRQHLTGIVIMPIGGEDSRIWEEIERISSMSNKVDD